MHEFAVIRIHPCTNLYVLIITINLFRSSPFLLIDDHHDAAKHTDIRASIAKRLQRPSAFALIAFVHAHW
jgi:hypothetical protein